MLDVLRSGEDIFEDYERVKVFIWIHKMSVLVKCNVKHS